MGRLVFKTFASKLSFYILILSTLIFVTLAAIFVRYTAKRSNDTAVIYSSALLKTVLDDTALELGDVEHLVDMIKPQIEHAVATPDSISGLLADMVSRDNLIMGAAAAFEPGFFGTERPLVMKYAYITPDGRRLTKDIDGETYNYPEMEWYSKARAAKSPVWSDPYKDDGGGERLMTTYSVPLLDDSGDVYGVVTADVSIEELVDFVEKMRPIDEGYTFIINRRGEYITHPDSMVVLTKNIKTRAAEIGCPELADIGEQMIQNKSGHQVATLNGEKMLACYAPLRETGWSACYVCPYNTILDTLGDVSLYIYVTLLLGLVALSVLIRSVIMRQTRPMKQLTEAAYKMSSGDFDAPLPTIDTNDELQHLHDGFVYMQTSLKEYISQLTDATKAKERIASELSIAHDIQMNLLPRAFSLSTECPTLDIYASLCPAKEVGGDFYDFVIHGELLYFTIGDVSGKGVPAALIMAITRSRFRIFCEQDSSPAEIVKGLNSAFCHENDAFMFVTMFVGVLNMKTRRLTLCNAGHNPSVVVSSSHEARFMDVEPNLAIGVDETFDYREQEMTLRSDESLLLYTDGLTEAERADHVQFGEQRVLDFATAHASASSRNMISLLKQAVDKFVDGAEPSDDLTLMSIKLVDTDCPDDSRLTMTNSLTEIDRLHAFVDETASRHALSDSQAMSLNLALEEAVVNVIDYAYPADTKGDIILAVETDGDSLVFKLIDHGAPFDPTKVPDADTTLDLEDRPIGGLGIFLIRQIMERIEYQRVGDANRLTMTYNPQKEAADA